jgi:hypothetical protein
MKHLKTYKLFEDSNNEVMYHVTHKKNIDSILQNGLLINQPTYMTYGGSWSHKVYGCNPIFLSSNPKSTAKQELLEKDDVVFEVNCNDLELVTDLPAMIDWGAYISDDLKSIWFKNKTLKNFCDEDGLIWFEDLLNSDLEVTKDAIELTGSAAVLSNITPDKLKLI